MKKKACAILVGTVLICQTASVYGAVQDYQAVTKADKEDNKTIQTFQTEDGDGNTVTVAAVNDILYVTAKDAGIYSKPGEDTEKLADVSLGDELSRSAVCDNGWSKVSCEVDGNQIIGYIQNQMLSDTDQIEPANEEVEVKSDATVLDYPGRKDGEEIGEVLELDQVKQTGTVNKVWSRIEYQNADGTDAVGYIPTSCLNLPETAETEEDTIDKIAGLYDVSVEEIAYINQIPYPYRLAVGEALLIPDGVSSGVKMTASANGYAYPYISPWVLRQTLPYMSGLLVFSYGFTEEGELIQPVPSDDTMRRMAEEYGRNAYLTLTPLGPDGKFSNSRIHAVLTSEESTERLLSELQREVREKKFRGVDVDFEYILKEDRDLFTAFVRELRVRMNEEGYLVSVALAPKTSAEQPGLLYEGKDYGGLGEAANQVLLMTYEWGYRYGPPMAVAPLNKVRQVVEYALTEIPSEKILLGVPNYGYDWILPFMRGESQAVTIGHVEAVQIAINNSAVIEFDETAQSPYFTYEKDNVRHEVWFEDVRSLSAKYSLIKEYNLRGMAVWQIMRLFRAMWILFDDFFEKRE